MTTDSNQLVPQIRNAADVVDYEGSAPSLAHAVAQLQQALGGVRPDDMVFEYQADDRGVKLRFHAYRHRDGRA